MASKLLFGSASFVLWEASSADAQVIIIFVYATKSFAIWVFSQQTSSWFWMLSPSSDVCFFEFILYNTNLCWNILSWFFWILSWIEFSPSFGFMFFVISPFAWLQMLHIIPSVIFYCRRFPWIHAFLVSIQLFSSAL